MMFLSKRSVLIFMSILFTCNVAIGGKKPVPENADDIRPILIGQKIPAITLTSLSNQAVDLNSILSEKPSLLVFYRGGWCPYCNLHLAELRKIESSLKGLGFQILAISPDKPALLSKTIDKHDLGYTLLSDSRAEAIRTLGLAFKVGDATRKKYKSFGIDLEKSSGESHHLLPVPAALLVNKEGVVTFSFIAPNYKVRASSEVILAAARAQNKQ